MDKKQDSLLKYVKKEILEHLLRGFCEKFHSGMKIACFNNQNELILIKEDQGQENRYWSHICYAYRKILNNEEHCNNCDLLKSEKILSHRNPKAEYYYCEPLGMIDMIAPITVEGHTLGTIITGQIILDKELDDFKNKLSQKFPDKIEIFHDAILKETQKTTNKKILSAEKITQLLSELQKFADLIGDIGSEFAKNLTFLERAAHSLSLPMQSVLIESCNLVEEINNNDTKKLYNEVQSLSLVVENILHGSGSLTIQGIPDFSYENIFCILGRACEMFKVEAQDKGCDLIPYITIENQTIQIDINSLNLKKRIYKNLIFENYIKKILSWNKAEFVAKDIKFECTRNGKTSYFDLIQVIEESYKSIYESGTNIELVIHADNNRIKVDPDEFAKIYLPNIEMNPRIIELALKNLIHNAVKYSYHTVPSGKKRFVEINCRIIDFAYCEISIANYGVGIREEEIKHGKIWESRYRGYHSQDRNRTGAGLGLSHVKWAICNIHSGSVDCKSTNLGSAFLTNFTIKLPVNQK